MKITKTLERQIKEISELADYALSWTGDTDHQVPYWREYQIGGYETVGMMLSCWLYDKFGISEGVSDMVEYFKLDEYPNRKKIAKKLTKLIKEHKQ